MTLVNIDSKDRLLQEFVRATLNYKRSQLQMFQDDAYEYAGQLINKYGVDPEVVGDLYLGLTSD